IRKDVIIVADTIGGELKSFKKKDGEYDMKSVQVLLVLIKRQYPKKKNITILLEPNIPYDALVQAMDAARLVSVVEFAAVVKKELFPQISIGDAPPQVGN
ncbi:MAG: biopolymer transporter ExbD, partial [Patescibacteria group bacterium]